MEEHDVPINGKRTAILAAFGLLILPDWIDSRWRA